MRENPTYRLWIERLDKFFPETDYLTVEEVGEFVKRKKSTVYTRFKKIIKCGLISKVDLACQLSK